MMYNIVAEKIWLEIIKYWGNIQCTDEMFFISYFLFDILYWPNGACFQRFWFCLSISNEFLFIRNGCSRCRRRLKSPVRMAFSRKTYTSNLYRKLIIPLLTASRCRFLTFSGTLPDPLGGLAQSGLKKQVDIGQSQEYYVVPTELGYFLTFNQGLTTLAILFASYGSDCRWM